MVSSDSPPGAPRATRGGALGDRPSRAWQVLAALAAAALYLRTVGFGWVYDDQMEVALNTFVRSLSNLHEPDWAVGIQVCVSIERNVVSKAKSSRRTLEHDIPSDPPLPTPT